jgi:hypothetical protein
MKVTLCLILFAALMTQNRSAEAQLLVEVNRVQPLPSPWHLKVGQGLDPMGLISVPRRAGWLGERTAVPYESAAQPYIGIGYTESMPRSGWSFSADLGLLGQLPRPAVKFGAAAGAGPTVDDLLRDLRLSPLIQIGASYAF